MLSKAAELEAQRNIFIHSNWEFYHKPKNKDVVLKRSKIKYSRKDIARFNIEEIGENQIKQLKNIVVELKECANDLFGEFGQVAVYIEKK